MYKTYLHYTCHVLWMGNDMNNLFICVFKKKKNFDLNNKIPQNGITYIYMLTSTVRMTHPNRTLYFINTMSLRDWRLTCHLKET